jgi:hypothetical protein
LFYFIVVFVVVSMVAAGVLHGLVDVVCGDLCHPGILSGLQHQDPSLPPRSSAAPARVLQDMDIEEWWGAMTALHSLVTQCSSAKQALDEYLGVRACTKLLLPLVQECCSSSQTRHLGVALSDFILELSVHGSLCSVPRPFQHWAKLSSIQHHDQTQFHANSSATVTDRIISPFSTLSSSYGRTLADFSCHYFLKMSSRHQISSCLQPHAIFLHPSSYDQLVGSESAPPVRSSSNCLEPRTSFAGDRDQAASSAYGDRGGEFTELYLDDRGSTGRGSFSLHSASHLSLHAISRVKSHSTLYTPTPSVTGETTHTFEEYGVGYGGGGKVPAAAAHPSAVGGGSHRGAGEEQLADYSGTFLPMAAALRWGLAHRRNIILRIVYDTLLLRSDSANPNVEESAGLLMSLRKQSIEQYLQCFLSVEEGSGSGLRGGGRSGSSDSSQDVSISPTCVFRSSHLVVNLFSLCMVLGSGGGVQGSILRTLSHLIDGNPLNADMIHRTNLTLNISRFIFSHNNSYPRTPICHILSQLFSYKVTPPVFNSLVETASSVGGKHVTAKPMLLIPTKGVSQRVEVETDLDDVGCQILYLLGIYISCSVLTCSSYVDGDEII